VHSSLSKKRLIATCLLVPVALAGPLALASRHADSSSDASAAGSSKIKHVVVIMQENRTFDHYFGTYPKADGIPMRNGIPTVCAPDPENGTCVRPFRIATDLNRGGPHGQANADADINGGKMDGFVAQARVGKACQNNPLAPGCTPGSGAPDVMGYHDYREVPNYWAYAREYVLQDRMFAPNRSWSLPAHLFMVSEWSARCRVAGDPMSCVNALQNPGSPPKLPGAKAPDYAWTDLTYLLHEAGVGWAYYVFSGEQSECEDNPLACQSAKRGVKTPGIWNPLPYFDTVKESDQLANVQSISNFYAAAKQGTLPAVSWIAPASKVSEHPPALVSTGQSYVTGLVNTIMRGPDWSSTAIFISWDDWGGFYDHVQPPTVDENGYGLRVPGLVISPYAKRGYIDHQTLSFDAYVKFIEDVFLGGRRIDPATDGRPDPRPTVRENVKILGDLSKSFDFSQKPRKPLILPLKPKLLSYSALWKGSRVALVSTPTVNVKLVRDAARVGRVQSFQTNDPVYRCLRGTSLPVWSLPTEFSGRLLVEHVRAGKCPAGTWLIPA
jgi:phospholipase C